MDLVAKTRELMMMLIASFLVESSLGKPMPRFVTLPELCVRHRQKDVVKGILSFGECRALENCNSPRRIAIAQISRSQRIPIHVAVRTPIHNFRGQAQCIRRSRESRSG